MANETRQKHANTQRTQTMISITNQYKGPDRPALKTTVSSHDCTTPLLPRDILLGREIESAIDNASKKQDKPRKFLVQTPKIKPVGISFLGTQFNPNYYPGKLTSQNSTEDLHQKVFGEIDKSPPKNVPVKIAAKEKKAPPAKT
jgi:hypothetical protein